MTQEYKNIKAFKDKTIAPQERKDLQDKFKKDVPYWQRLNWQVQSDIWNDIRMNSKYGFQLFHKFLKENKSTVIKANGKGVDIVNQFQIIFKILAELFNFSEQQQIKKAVIKELSKQLGSCGFEFQIILFQTLKRSFEGNPVPIDYDRVKSELILSRDKYVDYDNQDQKQSKKQKQSFWTFIIKFLRQTYQKIADYNRNSTNFLQKCHHVHQFIKIYHRKDQYTDHLYENELSTNKQDQKTKKYCLIRQSHVDQHLLQNSYNTFNKKEQQQIKPKLNKVFIIDFNHNQYKKRKTYCSYDNYERKIRSQIQQHSHIIIEVDLENENSSNYVNYIIQLLSDKSLHQKDSKQQKIGFQHVQFLLLYLKVQNSINCQQKKESTAFQFKQQIQKLKIQKKVQICQCSRFKSAQQMQPFLLQE